MEVGKEEWGLGEEYGAEDLVILKWHELNIPPLGVAADLLHREHGMTVLTVQACFVAEDMFGKECGGLTHGGGIEALAGVADRPGPGPPGRLHFFADDAPRRKGGGPRGARSFPAGAAGGASIA